MAKKKKLRLLKRKRQNICLLQLTLAALNADIKKHITGKFRPGHLTSLPLVFLNAGNADIPGESMISIEKYIKDNSLKILVKTNAPKNEIIGWDDSRKALKISVKAVPEKGKANKEIVKFLGKILKKRVFIVSGLKSKEKILKIE